MLRFGRANDRMSCSAMGLQLKVNKIQEYKTGYKQKSGRSTNTQLIGQALQIDPDFYS